MSYIYRLQYQPIQTSENIKYKIIFNIIQFITEYDYNSLLLGTYHLNWKIMNSISFSSHWNRITTSITVDWSMDGGKKTYERNNELKERE